MVYVCLLFSFCLSLAQEIGYLSTPPYDSVSAAILTALSLPFSTHSTYADLLSCQSCNYVLVPSPASVYFGDVSSSPLFSDRLVKVWKDERGEEVKRLLWQFLVLIGAIWLPALLIVSQVVYLVEDRKRGKQSYVYGSLLACWATFNLSKSKRDSMKVWLAVSWLFLSFLLLLIFVDLASSFSALNSYETNAGDLYNTETCLSCVHDGPCDLAVFGLMEIAFLASNDKGWNDDKDFIMFESMGNEVSFSLTTPSSADQSQLHSINAAIRTLWLNDFIGNKTRAIYGNLPLENDRKRPLFLMAPEAVFTGLTLLSVFVLVFLVFAIADLARRKERAVQMKLPELKPLRNDPSPPPVPARPGRTLSLGSLSQKEAGGRPGEDWMQAVPVDDAHVQGIHNIQEYENELSAVPQANPSLGVSDSVFSLFKLEKRK